MTEILSKLLSKNKNQNSLQHNSLHALWRRIFRFENGIGPDSENNCHRVEKIASIRYLLSKKMQKLEQLFWNP